MKILINPGHVLKGKGTGAVGYLVEGQETRKIANAVKRYLEGKGHEVVLINIAEAESQAEYLSTVRLIANRHPDADLFLSIHLNAGGGKGCECYTWKGRKYKQAVNMCNELSKLGFRNRGVKDGSHLYLIRTTVMETALLEVCFVDSHEDYTLYKKQGVNKIAQAITRGIVQ